MFAHKDYPVTLGFAYLVAEQSLDVGGREHSRNQRVNQRESDARIRLGGELRNQDLDMSHTMMSPLQIHGQVHLGAAIRAGMTLYHKSGAEGSPAPARFLGSVNDSIWRWLDL